tara:strand:- start:281 stop:1339 length:1059 start_codon:yes stop_codon:yes gene_type:complete
MYKFKLHSVDGVSSRKYSDLDQFEKDWTDGSPSDFAGGTYVTPDGITVIYPDNDRTLQALHSRYEAYKEMQVNPISMLQKEIFEAVGIEPEALDRLRMANDVDFTVDTKVGQARIVPASHPLFDDIFPFRNFSGRVSIDSASFALSGVVVAKDLMSDVSVIIDTESRGESFEKLLERPPVLAMALNYHVESFEGFDDDGVYASSKISGQLDIMEKVDSALSALAQANPSHELTASGHSNSQKRPLDEFLIKRKLNTVEINGLETAFIHKATGEDYAGIVLNEKTLPLLGSSRKGVYVREGDDVRFVEQGNILLVNSHKNEFSVHNKSELSEYQEYDKNDLENSIPEHLQMPF